MEHSLSSIAFKGSITEAIMEAKQQKKLFVVYISGDNPESNRLETTTWADSRVAESASKYCVLLHLSEGSIDAMNFSAIYPQKPAPCISVVGYNGVQVWQNEGFVDADFLATSLEKTWLSLHLQETAATFLASQVASQTEFASGTSKSASLDQGSSSNANELSRPTERTLLPTEAAETGSSQILEEKVNREHEVEERNPKTDYKASRESRFPDKVKSSERDDVASMTGTGKDPSASASASIDPNDGEYTNQNESSDFDVLANSKGSQDLADEAKEDLQNMEVETADVSHSTSKSNDVHLSVRLPDGSSLQVKFSIVDTLAMVKDYVDKYRTSNFGSYHLAIPYPRKVFDDQDLGKQLSELGLSDRQALVVILHHQATSYPRGGLASRNQTNATSHDGSGSGSNEGYWGFVRRMVSYMNPLSYVGGGPSPSNSVQDTQRDLRQYLRDSPMETGRPHAVYSSNQTSPGESSSSNKRSRQQQSPRRFGSNIHTLKHDEDSSRSGGRNQFWNGNSTNFGGDDDGKK